MDPNNQRLRLQVLNSTNPSIRVATAPQQPNISIAPAAQSVQPNIIVPQAPAGSQPQQQQTQQPVYTPPQHTSFWGHVANVGRDVAAPFVHTGEDVSNAIGNAEVGLAHTLGLANDVKTQTNQQQFGEIDRGLGIQSQDNTVKNFAGNVLQIAPVVAAPFTGGGSLALEAGADAGLGAVAGVGNAMTQKDQSLGSYLKNAAIGGALGGAGRFIGAGVGKVFNNLTGKATADAVSNAIAQEGDAGTIQAALGTTPDLAHFLAQETDPQAIKNVLNEAGVDTTKNSLQTLEAAATAKKQASNQGSQNIDFLDPMNPKQSQLPAGWHPDSAPDPVPVLAAQAQKTASMDEFKTYINGLTGEDKAAAESALNGMTPEEFYAKAGGGSSVTGNAKPTTGAGSLPQEDLAAIKAAGGTPPGNLDIPTLSKTAKNSFENVAEGQKPGGLERAAGEIDNGSALPIKYRKTPEGDTVIEDGRHRLEAARVAGVNDFPTQDVTAQYGALPAEDQAAIKAAGGELPTPVKAVAAQTGEATDQAVADAKQQVMDSLSGATREYNKSAAVRASERGSRSAQGDAAFEAAGGGQAGVYAKLGALKGDYTKSGFGIDIAPEAKDALLNDIQKNPNLQPFEKTNAQLAVAKLSSDSPAGPTPFDIKVLRKAFGDDFGDSVQQAVEDGKTFGQKATSVAGQVAALPKSIMASFDLSGTLRQGGILASRFPKEAASAFQDQLHYFASNDSFEKGMAEIAARPSYQSMLDSKLAVTGTEALDKTEEQYVGNLAEKIPGFGRGVAASDRAYTGFLTKLRADVFDKVTSAAQAAGTPLSDKETADLARFINTASGRGDLGKYLEQHSQTLSTALFSPRLWKSRLDTLNPVYYAKLSGPARSLALQSAGTFAAEAGTVLGLLSLVPGVHVETDPRSSDFAKIKYNNTRYDLLGGLQQNIVFAWREISGQTKSAQTGNVTQLGQKFGGADRLSIATDMIQNKENPLLSAASQILKGKDRGGNPVNPWTTVAQLAIPLPFSGVAQIAQDQGSIKDPLNDLRAVAMAAPDTFGISAQTYGSIPTKNQGKPLANGQPTYNGPVNPNMVTDYNGKVVLDKNGKPVTVTFPQGASALTKQSLIDAKRTSAVKEQYVRSLPQQTQELMKLSDSQLKQYVQSGQISQSDFDHIKNVQKTADSVSKGNNYAVPEGANSPAAKQYFQHFNSMDAKDQKAWLDQPADSNSTQITQQLNSQRMKGLDSFQPSNKLAQLYANYEKDINTHTSGDGAYTAIDLRNKAKAFQTAAAKMNYNSNVNDMYSEGGSNDMYTLAKEGKIAKPELDQAIALDNQLYAAGLTSSLKFSKTFRNAFGYSVPTGGPASSGSGGGSSSGRTPGTYGQQLGSFVKTPSTKALPKFKQSARPNPVTTIKFNAPQNVIPANGSSRVTAGGFKTTKLTTLRNSVAN